MRFRQQSEIVETAESVSNRLYIACEWSPGMLGLKGIRILSRHGTCRPGIDGDIPIRGRVEVPKQRHNCVGGSTNLSNQVGFIGPSDAGQVWRMSDAVSDTTSIAVLSAE